MVENRFGNDSKRFDDEPVVIGLFAHASDARWALQSLDEHGFTPGQIVAAFRTPGDARVQANAETSPMGGNGKWFGQLREIYRGGGAVQTRPESTGFDTMLAQIDLSADQDREGAAAIVTVEAGGRNHEARALLQQRGARIVRRRPDPVLPEPSVQPADIVHSTSFNPPAPAEPDHIQLFGEVVRVRKEKVSSGDVQVRKEAVTHMETVQVPVTREHLVVEQSDARGHIDSEHAIRVPLSEERVHIDKDTVLREEYKVGKREVTQNQSVTDTVRRERLLIDEAGTRTNDEF
jgi:uncharacterized protein (TIGR02271 family)